MPGKFQDPAQIRLKESYPAHIRYTTNAQAGEPDGHAEYDVEFLVMAKDEDVQGDKGIAETGYLLKEIKVWYQRSTGETKQLVRRYEFEYEDYDDPDYYLLTSITQVGPDGQALPATEFAYSLNEIGWGEGAHCAEERPFLATVDNGYGGLLTFAYQTWSEYESECIYRQTVQQEVVSSGIGVPITHTYTYTGADVEVNDRGVQELYRLRAGHGRERRGRRPPDRDPLPRYRGQAGGQVPGQGRGGLDQGSAGAGVRPHGDDLHRRLRRGGLCGGRALCLCRGGGTRDLRRWRLPEPKDRLPL